MESDSQPASPGRSSSLFAEIIGTFIALLTLTLPFAIIAHYSSTSSPANSSSYNTQQTD
jgi:hypothetical protein